MSESRLSIDMEAVATATALAGRNAKLRDAFFDALRQAEAEADNPAEFRASVRLPIVLSLLSQVQHHQIKMENGLTVEVSPCSRIERAFLMSAQAHPDHVWEPQTTKLLLALAAGAAHVIVGGAYIGDQVLPLAQTLCRAGKNGILPQGVVHAFEPMETAYRQLLRNLELNHLSNVRCHRAGLWDQTGLPLCLEGPAALATSAPACNGTNSDGETVLSITIDDYVEREAIRSVDLIMLDTEGGEEKALRGAQELLAQTKTAAPNLVFEVHRHYVDWTPGLENTSVVRLLTSNGYSVFAVRDIHDNYPMAGQPIEVVPVESVYLKGPPHGFNLFATKDAGLVERLGLRLLRDVSPKLIPDKDPALHHPAGGF